MSETGCLLKKSQVDNFRTKLTHSHPDTLLQLFNMAEGIPKIT